ncbi:MAG: aspartate-semialdehyde dehydrogenase [bacterium]|nr:aspartate-semialdehyde dehydrogenase [bacterium]
MKKYTVAVIGVGVVGQDMIRVLKQRNFPIKDLKIFARSDRTITVDRANYEVKELKNESFEGVDIALFAGTEGEKGAAVVFAAEAVKRGAVVIDNGADFRMDKNVPLVVPEANAADIKKHKGVIANPNCSTIQMIVALAPIHKKFGLKRVIASTYQAVSGSGRSGIVQMEDEYKKWANKSSEAVEYPMGDPISFNLFPHIGSFAEDGYTTEEWKVVKETHKILHDDKIKISCTAVRVSVKTGHSEAVYIETSKDCTVDDIRGLLEKARGVIVVDDLKKNLYPMPIQCEGKDEVFVGRIRRDPFVKNAFWLWVVADNLRKGAATNAVQIAEELIKQ